MRRLIAVVVALVLVTPAIPARAQGIPVFDISNLAQLVEMATRTLTTLNTIKSQYELVTRMAKGIGPLNAYKIPDIATAVHDVARFQYGGTWLEGLNSGDARGGRYFATVHQLQRPEGLLETLPADAQRAIKSGYATIEILDSVAMMGGHQSAIVRTYQRQIADVIRLLESDIFSSIPGFHALTAIADKISAGQLISRRSDMAGNQLSSHVLEQLIAKNKRTRDAEAASMNMRLNALKDNGELSQSLVKNAETSLRQWRQGQTTDRVLVHVDTDRLGAAMVNRRLASYVAVSRGRYDAQIYTNDQAQLATALSREVSQQSALGPQQGTRQTIEHTR